MVSFGSLKKKTEFEKVYELGATKVDRYLVVKLLANNLQLSRLGFSINRKLGNAVVRNRIRRRLKEILRITPLKSGFDIVIIVRRSAAELDYYQLKRSAIRLISQHNIILHNNEKDSIEIN